MADEPSLEELINQLAQMEGNPTAPLMGSAAAVPQVWMGRTNPSAYTGHPTQRLTSEAYKPVAVDDAILNFQGWDTNKVRNFRDLLEDNGYEVNSYEELSNMWSAAVNAASESYVAWQAGKMDRPLTPQEVIGRMGQLNKSLFDGGNAQDHQYMGPTTTYRSSTESNVDLSSASEARALQRSAASGALGRLPTKGEAAGFQSGLNAEERDNPTVTSGSSTTVTDPGKHHTGTSTSDSSSTTTGGMDPNLYALEWAESRPDFAEFQAASTFMDALVSALGQQVGG